MKFLILLLISFSAFANFVKKEKVGTCNGVTYYTKANKCGENCIKIPSDYNCEYHEIIAETAMKEDAEPCVDEADCQAKMAIKECSSSQGKAIYTLDPNEVYCTWVRPEQVMENAANKATYEAAKAASDAQENAIAQAMKAIEHGKRVIALLAVRNVPKNLTTAQIETMNATYADVKNLLETGSLVTAKEKINAMTPDGTLVTEGDKTALIAEIDKFLGL